MTDEAPLTYREDAVREAVRVLAERGLTRITRQALDSELRSGNRDGLVFSFEPSTIDNCRDAIESLKGSGELVENADGTFSHPNVSGGDKEDATADDS